jgi:exodeoxyribonuclease V
VSDHITLSSSQQNALDHVAEWLKSAPAPEFCGKPECLNLEDDGEEYPHTHGHAREHSVLSVGGLAGTGKTYLMGQLSEVLGIRATLATPTNKAAAVLRGKVPEDQRSRCGTYHSLLYRPNSWHTCLASGETAGALQCSCGRGYEHDECACPRYACDPCGGAGGQAGRSGCRVESHLSFEPREFAGGFRDLLILDEASMVTEEQVEDIRKFGLPILLVGDHGQLPPVKGALSPWMKSPDLLLEENYRQQESSGIVAAALMARRCGTIAVGRYGTGTVVVNGQSMPSAYNAIGPDRLPPGPDSAILTWTNRRRGEINRAVHTAVVAASVSLTTAEAKLVPGDRLVSLGNYQCEVVKPSPLGQGFRAAGWQSFVYNGQTGTVIEVSRLSRRFADVVIMLDNAIGEIDNPMTAIKIVKRIDLLQLGSDKKLRDDERTPGTSSWDYAYCLTVHKAQGSEFNSVAVLGQGPAGPDRARWLYTSMTRARSKLLVII